MLRNAVLVSVLLLAACASDEAADYIERPPEDIYNTALDKLEAGEITAAAKEFEEVERQHPYSSWANRGQLMAAYAYYKNEKFDDALLALDRFIQLYPGHKDIAYAYYLRGLVHYEQINDVRREQGTTQAALDALSDVVRRFPGTSYARDAALKIDLTRDHLAGHEMEVGRFYQKQGQYNAAIRRYRMVLDQYQTTSHIPEALLRLTECYLALGLVEEAKQNAAVLGHNYPGSEWYEDAFALLQAEGYEHTRPANPGILKRLEKALF